MAFCRNCGKEIDDKAVICVHCGVSTEHNTKKVSEPDMEDANAGLKVLSFFFPLVGLILFIVYNQSRPTASKSCGIWALIGFGVWLVIYIFRSILFASIFTGLVS